MGARPVKDRR